MNTQEAEALVGKPIFAITPETVVRQIWFVGSNKRDLLGMLYQDEEDGWLLKYRWRHYAEAVSKDNSASETAWDGKDTKSVYSVKLTIADEEDLDKAVEAFHKAMQGLHGALKTEDPNANLWTRSVKTGDEVIQILSKAPWAHVRTISTRDEDKVM